MTKELQTFLKSQLRRISYKWPAYSEAWRRAKGTGRGYYMCADCGKYERRMNCQLDHKEPVIPIAGWDGIEGFVRRLFCDADGLQVLGKDCHQKKTNAENERRRL